MWTIPEKYVGKKINVMLKIPAGDGQFAGMIGTLEHAQPGAFIVKGDNGKTIMVPCDMVVNVLLETSDVQVVSGNVLSKFPKQ
jgi:hypothetical protein